VPALYGEIFIPPGVRSEIQRPQALVDASWLSVQRPHNRRLVSRLRQTLDAGESEAIALAIELGGLLLIDDRSGRLECARRGVPHVGGCGVLLAAKVAGHISEVRSYLAAMRRTTFLSSNLIRRTLTLAGELP
jgi:predicted nucleic acid-binding protein